ncbi:MAG: hypothetical protein ISR58_07900 [Anaerolineales bacterium]|nr:hypothetical protein [Anaerolineales bacterium]
MKYRWILLVELIILLGLGACTLQETPAQVQVVTFTPSISVPPTESNKSVPSITESPSQTESTELTATTTTTPPPLSCWNEGGYTQHHQLFSDFLPDPLIFRVHLPPCYDQQPEKEYPILYLLHGQSYGDDQWDRLGVDETADRLIALGEIPPFIIVLPAEQDHNTPPPESPYGDAIVNELLPYINETYRIIDKRAYRAIGGLSRGGNWAVHLGLIHWELFGTFGAHSSPSFVTEGPPRIREYLQAIPDDKLPHIYMDAGENDGWIEYTLKLEAVFTEENIPHEWFLFQGTHDEEYWANHIEDYLRWYTQGW